LRELGDVLRARTKALPFLDAGPQMTEAFEDLLRALAVLPELGLRGLRF
jgi:hypothetical protein